MIDKPILFSAPMVRAILAGTKTQTRRVLKPQPIPFMIGKGDDAKECEVSALHVEGDPSPRVTLGRVITHQEVRWSVGDRLWVRETWQTLQKWDDLKPRYLMDDVDKVRYVADEYKRNPLWAWGKLRPSIFMPRWASRIALEVTAVRVERLQGISAADARAEGIVVLPMQDPDDPSAWWESGPGQHQARTAVGSYCKLWDHINGAGSWDASPWVVAVTFRRVANAD